MLVFESKCKDCGNSFKFNEQQLSEDRERSRSTPERCFSCRKKNHKFINSIGVAYWRAPVEFDANKKCYGKYGLGKLQRVENVYHTEEVSGIDPKNPPEHFKQINPVADRLIENLESPSGTQVSIVVAPTGTGKSTWIPYRILRSKLSDHGTVLVTQPRLATLKDRSIKKLENDKALEKHVKQFNRIEDRTTPGYIAQQLCGSAGVGQGEEVGVKFRGESSKNDRYNKLLFVTDGLLIRFIISDQLHHYSAIVIDEAHEQSSNMELIFALLRTKLALHPNLKLIIASATIDIEKFANFFGDGDTSKVFIAKPEEGELNSTLEEIFVRWPEGESGYRKLLDKSNFHPIQSLEGLNNTNTIAQVSESFAEVIVGIREKGITQLGDPMGDILIFLPTVTYINLVAQKIKELKLDKLHVLVCHAKWTASEENTFNELEFRAKKSFLDKSKQGFQRVIVATNYVQTGITISNLKYVLDSGLVLNPLWRPETSSKIFPISWESRAGCEQRKGRVGRQQEGECFRLFPEEIFNNPAEMQPKPVAQISREPMDQLYLTASLAGVVDLKNLKLLGGGDLDLIEINRSISQLHSKGLLDQDGDITKKGKELEALETDTIDLRDTIAKGDKFSCVLEISIFLGYLNLTSPIFARNSTGEIAHYHWSRGCWDDLDLYLRIYFQWRNSNRDQQWARNEGLLPESLLEWDENILSLLKQYSLRTHEDEKMFDRNIDLERLHRVRIIVTFALREWIFYLNVFTTDKTGHKFIPLFENACPLKNKDINISRSSVCFEHLIKLQAFVCVSRLSDSKGNVYGESIIRLDMHWLQFIEDQPPSNVKLALFLKNSLSLDDERAKLTTEIVEKKKLSPRLNGYKIGDEITLKTTKLFPHGKDAANEVHLIVETSNDKQVNRFTAVYKGDILDVPQPGLDSASENAYIIQKITKKHIVLGPVPQNHEDTSSKIELKVGSEIEGEFLKTLEDANGGIKGVEFTIAPGRTGFLPARLLSRIRDGVQSRVEQIKRLKKVPLFIKEIDSKSGRIILKPKYKPFKVGGVYSGVLAKVELTSNNVSVLYALVELRPESEPRRGDGIRGKISRIRGNRTQRDVYVPNTALSMLRHFSIGTIVKVKVKEKTYRGYSLSLVEKLSDTGFFARKKRVSITKLGVKIDQLLKKGEPKKSPSSSARRVGLRNSKQNEKVVNIPKQGQRINKPAGREKAESKPAKKSAVERIAQWLIRVLDR